MRLIDADALLRECPFSKDTNEKPLMNDFEYGENSAIDCAVDVIKDAPTVDAFVCPVKPGQTVYSIIDGCVAPHKIMGVFFEKDEWELIDTEGDSVCYPQNWLTIVFPTREAAEKKLEEMKGENK